MHWNYRVVKKNVYMGKTISSEVQFGIYEAYYNDKDEPTMITTDNIAPYGETVEELKDDLTHMMLALEKPVLDWEYFKNKEVSVSAKALSGGSGQ